MLINSLHVILKFYPHTLYVPYITLYADTFYVRTYIRMYVMCSISKYVC